MFGGSFARVAPPCLSPGFCLNLSAVELASSAPQEHVLQRVQGAGRILGMPNAKTISRLCGTGLNEAMPHLAPFEAVNGAHLPGPRVHGLDLGAVENVPGRVAARVSYTTHAVAVGRPDALGDFAGVARSARVTCRSFEPTRLRTATGVAPSRRRGPREDRRPRAAAMRLVLSDADAVRGI